MSVINVGIVGFGYAAQTFHLPFLKALAEDERVAIAMVSSSDAAKVHAHLPGVDVVSDPAELCQNPALDLVIITSPNDSHAKWAEFALTAGNHVLLEKPLTTRLSDAEHLATLAEKQQRMLVPFQNRRWDGDFLTLKQLIAEQAVGPIHYFESHFDRFRPQPRDRWRENGGEGSGIYWDLAPHLIDQTVNLFGMPQTITANLRALRPGAKSVDYFHLLLGYEDKEVVLAASPYMAAPNPRFVLQGEKGSYIKLGLDPQEDALKLGVSPLQQGFGAEAEADWGRLHNAEVAKSQPTLAGDYVSFYRQLLAAIRGEAAAPVPVTDAVGVIRLLELGELSAKEQRTVSCQLKHFE
ncbi:oxidoreductase [Corallincola platygyrae]|uniref:Oxidoreductase n=1 Tax=Corallincola platygyrae TaxID=1193278 RepID=A0ABW4XQC8_9GAMM